jgi:hypothetical protein
MADLTPEDHELLKGMIAEVMAGDKKEDPAPVAAPAPQKIKMNIAGQEMEFDSLDDVSAKMTEVVKIAQSHIAATPTPKKVEATVTGDDAPGFNYDKYAELMTAGKITDGIGMVVRELPEFKQLRDTALQATTKLAAFEFKANHPELATLAPQVIQGVAGAIQKTQSKYNLSTSSDGLEAAYYLAQRDGLIPDFKTPVPPPVPQNVPQNNPYLDAYGNMAAPPVVNRGGDNLSMQITEDQMEAMDEHQLAQLISRWENRR